MKKCRWMALLLAAALALEACSGFGGAGVDGQSQATKAAAVVPSFSFPDEETKAEPEETKGSYWDSVAQKNAARYQIEGTDAFYIEDELKKQPERIVDFQTVDLLDEVSTVYAYQAVEADAKKASQGQKKESEVETTLVSRFMIYNTKTKARQILFERNDPVKVIWKNGRIQMVLPAYETRKTESNQMTELFVQKMQNEGETFYFVFYGGECIFYELQDGKVRTAHSRNIYPDLALTIKKYKEQFKSRYQSEIGNSSPAIAIEAVSADTQFNVFLRLTLTKNTESVQSTVTGSSGLNGEEVSEEEAKKAAEEAQKQAENAVKSMTILMANYRGQFGRDGREQTLAASDFESGNQNFEAQYREWYTEVDGKTFESESEVPSLAEVKKEHPDRYAPFTSDAASYEDKKISIFLRSVDEKLAALPSFITSDWDLSGLSINEETCPYITGGNVKEYGGAGRHLAAQMRWESGENALGFFENTAEFEKNSLKEEVRTEKRTYYISEQDDEGNETLVPHQEEGSFIVKRMVSLTDPVSFFWTLAMEENAVFLFSPLAGNVLYSQGQALRLMLSDQKTLHASEWSRTPEIPGELRSVAVSQQLGTKQALIYSVFTDEEAVIALLDPSDPTGKKRQLYGVSNWDLYYDSSRPIDGSELSEQKIRTESYPSEALAFVADGSELWMYGAGLNGIIKCRLTPLSASASDSKIQIKANQEAVTGGELAPYCSYALWMAEDQKSCMVIGFPTSKFKDYTARDILYAKLFRLDLTSEDVCTNLVKSVLSKGRAIYQKYLAGTKNREDELLAQTGFHGSNAQTQYAREYYRMQRTIYQNKVHSYQTFLKISGIKAEGEKEKNDLLRQLLNIKSVSALEKLIYEERSDLREEETSKGDVEAEGELQEAIRRLQKRLSDGQNYTSDEWEAVLQQIVDDFNPPDTVREMQAREALNLYAEVAGVRRRDSMEDDINACEDYQDMEKKIVSYYSGKGALWDALEKGGTGTSGGKQEESEDQKAERIIRERKEYALAHLKVTKNGKSVTLEEKYGTGWWKQMLEEILQMVKEKNKVYNEVRDKALSEEETR